MLIIRRNDPNFNARKQKRLDTACRQEVAAHFKAIGKTPTTKEALRYYQKMRRELAPKYT